MSGVCHEARVVLDCILIEVIAPTPTGGVTGFMDDMVPLNRTIGRTSELAEVIFLPMAPPIRVNEDAPFCGGSSFPAGPRSTEEEMSSLGTSSTDGFLPRLDALTTNLPPVMTVLACGGSESVMTTEL